MIIHPRRLNEPEFVNALTEMMCRATPKIYEAQIHALLNRPDYRPVLRTIDCPTLIACGREDLWSPLAQHEEMAAAIPGARLEAIDDCAHMATVECPAAVIRLLREWMTG